MPTHEIDADDVLAAAKKIDLTSDISGPALARDRMEATLEDLTETWRDQRFSRWGGAIENISVTLDVDPEDEEAKALIHVGDHDIPATDRGLEALARHLKVPVRYLLAVPGDEQQFILTKRLERQGEENYVGVEFNSEGVQTVRKSGSTVLQVTEVLDKTIDVLGHDALVRDAWFDHRTLRIDAFQPEPLNGVLVGVRVSQDRKQNLAPKVQPIIYRIEGSITVEVEAWGIKVEARNKDEFEILDELRYQGERALEHATHDRKSYLDMSNQSVDADRSAHLRRLALDAGLSDRATNRITDNVAAVVGERKATMLDFVNLIAAQANFDPTSNQARTLQQAAGSLVDDHTARCKTCHHRLV